MPLGHAEISRLGADLLGSEVHAGLRLHQSVHPSRWCVTFTDLEQLRHIVTRAVRAGHIAPTIEDSFDPEDDHVGPSVAAVTRQLIKPVTAQLAGGASWALMLHPDGLQCDLFVTHCWAEGTLEFLDKVLSCWPRSAQHAYCCMLSNPQNSDIGSLLDRPEDSPFAQALRSARYMMVVPNGAFSIYTRMWCVYEAFLAYSWEKHIFTAQAPVRSAKRRGCGMLLLYVISHAPACLACHTSDLNCVLVALVLLELANLTLF